MSESNTTGEAAGRNHMVARGADGFETGERPTAIRPRDAEARHADLRDADMRGADLRDADLRDVDSIEPHGKGGRIENENERADRNWNDLLQEVRVTQTCTQILGGFLLAVAFQPRFVELDAYERGLYLVLVALAGFATILSLALVTLHRRHFGKLRKVRLVLTGSRLLKANLVVVALLTSGVTALIFDFVLGRTAGIISLVVVLVFSAGLGVFVPLASGKEEEAHDSEDGV